MFQKRRTKNMPINTTPDLALFRHAVATMVYRGSKTFRDAPGEFGTFRIKIKSRTPVEIVAHMGDLFDWALSMAKGKEIWRDSIPLSWKEEIARFYASVKAFDDFLSSGSTIECSLERLLQGPVADAITHVGQLAMLRHLYGSPIKGENYFKAEITVGHVSPVQAPAKREFD
jgi:hypothetical protein